MKRKGLRKILLGILLLCLGCIFYALVTPSGSSKIPSAQRYNQNNIYYTYYVLVLMRLDVKVFPTSSEGLSCLSVNNCNFEAWDGPYSTMRNLKDYWQRPFVYINDVENKYLKIYSVGPNGIDEDGKGDDIICERVCITDLLDLGFATDELADGGIYYHRLPKQN